MDLLIKLVSTTGFIAAGTGLLLLNRSILLTSTYKFPYPVALTFIQIVATTVAGTLLRLFASLIPLPPPHSLGPQTTSPSYAYSRLSNEDFCLQDDALLPHAAGCFDPEDLREVPADAGGPSKRRLGLSHRIHRLTSYVKYHYHCQCRDTSRLLQGAFALMLAVRLTAGNILLCHAPFASYALVHAVSLPLAFGLNYGAESASSALFPFTASLSLCLASVNIAQPIGIASTCVGILFASSDALVGHLGVKVVQRRWSFAQASSSWAFSLDNMKGISDACHSIREPLVQLLSILTRMSLLASVILLPMLLLSGEVGDVLRDCYVLTVPQFRRFMLASVSVHGAWLTMLMALLSGATPTGLTFLGTPLNSVALAVFCHHKFGPYNWINLSLCWAFCIRKACCSDEGKHGQFDNRGRSRCVLLRQIFLIAVAYGAIFQGSYTVIEYLQTGAINLPSFIQTSSKITAVIPNTKPLFSLNGSSVEVHDYLGPRPNSNTVADFEKIMSNCGDSHKDSGVSDIVECLNYLATGQDDYFMSETTSSIANSVGAKSRFSNKVSLSPKDSCKGPIRTYHTYWAGHATWRVELFIKAYLYSQNLACSRLWIWLDADIDVSAMKTMISHDPLFQRFRPLLEEGYITLKEWKIPSRVPLPRLSKALNPDNLYRPSTPGANGEVAVADGVIQDASGMLWLLPQSLYKYVATPTQVSDLVRFLVLHLHGGVYLDMDVLLLRDLRPLLLPSPHADSNLQPAWAEQWVEHARDPGDYNTAVLSLPANSSLTSYLLRGGLRMGMNFHPRVLGRMMWKDGRNSELGMLHNAVFDPLVTNLRRKGTGECTVPCHKNFESAFMGTVEEPEYEWSNYEGPEHAGLNGEVVTNRTMENFFRGAFAYHIHNQWQKFPEQDSWMDVITRTQDGFFNGDRTNAYGEVWRGPALDAYDRSEWGWNSDGELRA